MKRLGGADLKTDGIRRPPDVSVVVTACEDSTALRDGLDRLRIQASSLGAEVVVAFNVAADGIGATAREELARSGAHLLFEPQPGKSHALNAAVRAARGRVVAFTDDDALPDEGWLHAITEPVRAGEVTGCGGPVLPVFPPGGPPDWYRHLLGRTRSTFLGPFHFLGHRPLAYRETELGAGLPFGASCAYARDALLAHPYRPELGPNRKTGIQGGEDTELALHLLRAGHTLRYVPAARVHHPVRPERMTLAWVRDRHRTLGRETVRLRRALGDAVPDAATLREHIRTCEGRGLRRRLRKRRHRFRRALRRLSLEGELEEVLAS